MRGGDVTVTSEPGKGTVFTVHLPGDTIKGAMVPTMSVWVSRVRLIRRRGRGMSALPLIVLQNSG
jgi:hypothetical protein